MKKLINQKTKQFVSVTDLNLKNTLLNGQCFNWQRDLLDNKDQEKNIFIGVFDRTFIKLEENSKDGLIYYQCIPEANTLQIEKSFQSYFQLETDIQELCKEWSEKDPYFKEVNQKLKGLRILRQEPFECFISFMISQNNNIPRITQCVQALRRKYGQLVHTYNDQQFYSFPTIEQLKEASEQDLRDLGLGYRAKYISTTVKDISNKGGVEYLLQLRNKKDQKETKEKLIEFLGVGAKVADCISLFSMDCPGVIPVDTHVWQIYNKFYLKKSKPDKMGSGAYETVTEFFQKRFGTYAGWAHSYLFAADLGIFQKEMGKKSDANTTKKKKKTQKIQEDTDESDNEELQNIKNDSDSDFNINQKDIQNQEKIDMQQSQQKKERKTQVKRKNNTKKLKK